MRLVLCVLFVSWLGACGGPSAGQVRTAKLAQYNAQTSQMLDLAVQVAQRTYKVNDIDPAAARFVTAQQFYSAEGMRRGTSNEGNGDYINNLSGGDIILSLEVQVLGAEGGRVSVVVTPRTQQFVSGSPQPRPLAPDDPNLPGWVQGRVDQLAVDIYEAAKAYAQKP